MIIFHDSRCAEYGSAMRPEQPARVLATLEDRAEVAMADALGQGQVGAERAVGLRRAAHVGPENLDGHDLVVEAVDGAVDGGDRAYAQEGAHVVAAGHERAPPDAVGHVEAAARAGFRIGRAREIARRASHPSGP